MHENMNKSAEFIISEDDKVRITSIFEKLKSERTQNEKLTVVTDEELASFLAPDEMVLINRVYQINPETYGFKAPKLGIEPVPDRLIRVEPQKYRFKGEQLLTNTQYIPEKTYVAFNKLSSAAEKDLGRPLLVVSSYRSNAFQAITFLGYLRSYDYDVAKTAKRVAVPGYSEHTTPSQLALDLANLDGLPSDDNPQDFEDTNEYRWLASNAERFDFYESYPKDNQTGVMFEPWHWRHIPNTTKIV